MMASSTAAIGSEGGNSDLAVDISGLLGEKTFKMLRRRTPTYAT